MTRRKKLEERQVKREEWAKKADIKSEQHSSVADNLVRVIDGQGSMPGHHSYKAARGLQKRLHSNVRLACEKADLAKRHRSKIKGIENLLDKTIFSDDIDAIIALEKRIEETTTERGNLKRLRKAWIKSDGSLEKFCNLTGESIEFAQRCNSEISNYTPSPFPEYKIKNLSGKISRDKKKIKAIEQMVIYKQEAMEGGGFIYREKGEDVKFIFAAKPDKEIIEEMKSYKMIYKNGIWSGYTFLVPADFIKRLVESYESSIKE